MIWRFYKILNRTGTSTGRIADSAHSMWLKYLCITMWMAIFKRFDNSFIVGIIFLPTVAVIST